MRFCIAVIYYNPNPRAYEKLKIYSSLFEKVYIMDNSYINKDINKKAVTEFPNVVYFDMQGNAGMSKALNKAFALAISDCYDFILTMDQDSEFSEENIKNMINYIEKNNDKKIAIYVSNFSKLYWDSRSQKMVPSKPVIKRDEIKEIEFALTSSSFIRLSAIKKILPLEDYFISYVDNFISTDLRKLGYKIVRVGMSYFEQEVGNPVKSNWYNKTFRILNHTEDRYYYLIRNNCYYRKKYNDDIKIVRESYIKLLRYFFNIVMGEQNKIKKIRACIEGYKAYERKELGKKQ